LMRVPLLACPAVLSAETLLGKPAVAPNPVRCERGRSLEVSLLAITDLARLISMYNIVKLGPEGRILQCKLYEEAL